ncbi:MAG: folate family ECF transporter S component [Firmicutes bacterium]|nr:folate family ECF transporter S component [Bacillota bacterium]
MNVIEMISESSKELKKIRSLTGSALLAAMNIILDFMRIVVSSTLEISFAPLAIAAAGMFYGPVTAAIVATGADVLAFFLKPNGFFFAGFTLNAAITGFIYGMLFYKKEITLKRVLIAQLLVTVVVNLVLTPIWLKIMYGSELFAVARIIKNIVQYPVDVALCYIVCKNVGTVRKKILNN